ncbi:MAG: hypothetical protein AAFX85_19570, partial [Pseudomonadota bacterium]
MATTNSPVRLIGALALVALSGAVRGGELSLQVLNHRDQPLRGAVVFLKNPSGTAIPADTPAALARMDQVNEAFVPDLLVIPQGAQLVFSNS